VVVSGESRPQRLKPPGDDHRGTTEVVPFPTLQRAGGGQNYQFFKRACKRKFERIYYRDSYCLGRHHLFSWSLRPESIPNFGVGGTCDQCDHADSLRAQFLAQGACESQSTVFGCVVGGGSSKDAFSGNREIIHDGTATLHQGQGCVGHQKESVQVVVDDLKPGFEWEFFHVLAGMSDAGVVDQNVQPMKLTLDCRQQSFYGYWVSHIAHVNKNANFEAGQFPSSFLQGAHISGGDDKVTTFRSQRSSDGQANATIGASDERDFSAKVGNGRR